MSDHQFDFSLLADSLPSIIWRHRWNELAEKHGLPYRRGYMQNLDSKGRGPKRMIFRGRVAYSRENLIEWLISISA